MSTADHTRSTVDPRAMGSTFEGLNISQRAQTTSLPKNRENDPTALDVISNLIDDELESKASIYMKGHIDQRVINDTFLLNAPQKFPESTLRINCAEHDAPATFFSRQEQRYKCLECLVAREDLQYIDKSYKTQLEDFEKIKDFVAKAIVENAPNIHLIAEWKGQIRETLLKVKQKYIEWVESFTHKFVKSLNKIEHSQQLSEFIGEDKRQELRIIDMQNKYKEILKIFYSIKQAKPDDKLKSINHFKPEMDRIRQYITSKDKEMKKTTFRVSKAMRETVDVDGLADKIFTKYMKFVETKVRTPGPHISPVGPKKKVKIPNEPERTEDGDSEFDRENLGAMMGGANKTPSQRRGEVKPTKKPQPTPVKQAKPQIQEAAQQNYIELGTTIDLDTSVMTVTSRYRHENQNSIYYLKPNTADIYLLDFRIKGFLQEQLRWKRTGAHNLIPMQATSQQTSDSTIYVIGGYRQSSTGDVAVMSDCQAIDANLSVYEREKMKTPRFGAPLALIRDRFILAISGCTAAGSQTKHCEAFDTQTNHWFPIQDLPVRVTNTSTVVMNQRFIYLMPGSNQECRKGDQLMIYTLDTGSSSIFTGDKNDKSAGWPIGRQLWQSISVPNADFVRTQPTGGLQTGDNQMVIFGGETQQAFTFDPREVSQGTKQANVTATSGQLTKQARFAQKSDFVARLFREVAYLIDASEMMLHVYEATQQTWVSSPLSQVGIQ